MPPKKMTANPLKPARHRPGKPTLDEAPSASESSEEEEEEAQAPKTKPKPAPPKATSFPKSSLAARQKTSAQAGAEALARQKLEEEFETESESGSGSEGSESGSGSEEEGSSEEEEEESSSEDEAPKKLLRPVFIKKGQRNQASTPAKSQERIQAEEEKRKLEAANALVQEQIERAAALKAARKKNWDDEDNLADVDDVDDTDALVPDAEFAAWKLRELKRIKRDRAAIEAAEAERAEVERRRNLTQAERETEDRAFIEKQKEERGDRGQMQFMQKYFHKGAFFQDDLKEAGVDGRRVMGARFEDATNREVLPEYMQIRDMTKLGKKGRTKYKDMRSEDTGRWGAYGDRRGPKGGDFGLDDRFKPDSYKSGGRDGATGANAGPLVERKRVGEDDRRDGKRQRVDDRY